MSYAAAVRDFLQHQNSSEGILIIQSDGKWIHLPSGYAFHLVRYAAAEKLAETLLEAADELDQLKSK